MSGSLIWRYGQWRFYMARHYSALVVGQGLVIRGRESGVGRGRVGWRGSLIHVWCGWGGGVGRRVT
ncbi:hypothetical protein HPP92_009529 [Vanilla planifolia]|uniref:Uncharacterized protein n=1 Tax=Vanilla planifolia TaxID=51239 RepID=A0A835V4T0_VANPL|nr:hypothetical protein HPP92_009529 [Vanilla planifolia]